MMPPPQQQPEVQPCRYQDGRGQITAETVAAAAAAADAAEGRREEDADADGGSRRRKRRRRRRRGGGAGHMWWKKDRSAQDAAPKPASSKATPKVLRNIWGLKRKPDALLPLYDMAPKTPPAVLAVGVHTRKKVKLELAPGANTAGPVTVELVSSAAGYPRPIQAGDYFRAKGWDSREGLRCCQWACMPWECMPQGGKNRIMLEQGRIFRATEVSVVSVNDPKRGGFMPCLGIRSTDGYILLCKGSTKFADLMESPGMISRLLATTPATRRRDRSYDAPDGEAAAGSPHARQSFARES